MAILAGVAAAIEREVALSSIAFWSAIACLFFLWWLPSRSHATAFWYEGRHMTLLVRPSKTEDLNEFLSAMAKAKLTFLLGKLKVLQAEGIHPQSLAISVLEWFDTGIINKEVALQIWNELKAFSSSTLNHLTVLAWIHSTVCCA